MVQDAKNATVSQYLWGLALPQGARLRWVRVRSAMSQAAKGGLWLGQGLVFG